MSPPESWFVLTVAGAFFLLGIAASPLAWVALDSTPFPGGATERQTVPRPDRPVAPVCETASNAARLPTRASVIRMPCGIRPRRQGRGRSGRPQRWNGRVRDAGKRTRAGPC